MSRCPHCGGKHAAENHFCPTTGQPIELGPRLIAQNLLERFRVVTILGEGPIGIVVEVEEQGTGQRYAAKLIHPQFTRDTQSADKLLDDAMRAGNLGSRHIARVMEVGRDTGAALTVIRELMTGQCLQTKIEELGRLEVDEAIQITREILIALDEIHNAGMVNLDLSPADIFLAETDEGYCVKLVDIGERHIKQEIVLETDGGFESVNFYAPEQYDRSRQVNPRSDLYAAGAILYNMITGVIPSGAPEPVSSLRPGVPFELAQVIHTALASTPHNRFSSAADFINNINRVSMQLDGSDQVAHRAQEYRSGRSAELDEESSGPSHDANYLSSSMEESPSGQYQPSVIVDMPEMEQRYPILFTKRFRVVLVIVAALVLLVGIGMAMFSSGLEEGGAEDSSGEIVISVVIDPPAATISVDGKQMEGNPVTLTVRPDDSHHTILAKANGFESLERDVKFDKTQRIELELTEIISPDEDAVEGDKVQGAVAADLADTTASPPAGETPPEQKTAADETASKETTAEKTASKGEEVSERLTEDRVELPTILPGAEESPEKEDTVTSDRNQALRKTKKPRAKPGLKKRQKNETKKDTGFPKAPSRHDKKSREGFSTRNPFG